MLKQWNMVLIILTYALVIFGTFLTRSGVLSSVHAFAESAIGPLFFVFIGLTFILSLILLMWRWNSLRSETQMTSLLSREALFLFNNLLFIGILVVCFWGVIFPLISELATGQKVTVGPPFYERATAPLFAGLLLLMGIAPLAAWRVSKLGTLGKPLGKLAYAAVAVVIAAVALGVTNGVALVGFWLVGFVVMVTLYDYGRSVWARHRSMGEKIPQALWNLTGRNRRRYGGYIVHLGAVLMAVGIIGIELFQTETQGTIALGEEIALGDYTIRYDSLAVFNTEDGRNVARAVVGVEKDGKRVGELYPRRDYYYESQQPITIPGVRSTMADDFYVLLVDWQPVSTQAATFKVYHNPLVNWLWLGGLVFILGTMVAAWPEREKETTSVVVTRRAQAAKKA